MDATAQRRAVCCELVFDVARTSGEVCLKVTGTSMIPAIWPGDVVTVRSCDFAELQPGQIVLYHREAKLTVHRIKKVLHDHLITRGDSLLSFDPSVRSSEIAGRVVSILRAERPIRLTHSVWQRLVSCVLQRSNLCMRIALFLRSGLLP